MKGIDGKLYRPCVQYQSGLRILVIGVFLKTKSTQLIRLTHQCVAKENCIRHRDTQFLLISLKMHPLIKMFVLRAFDKAALP